MDVVDKIAGVPRRRSRADDGRRAGRSHHHPESVDAAGRAVSEPSPAGYKAVAKLYNALMTGLVLTLVTRKTTRRRAASSSRISAASIWRNSWTG